MTKPEALPLRFVLVALGLVALLSQTVLLPRLAGEYASAYPQVANLAVPYAAAGVAAVACFEVALLAAWRMLTAVVEEGVLTLRAAESANVMAVSLGLTGITFAGICAHAGSVAAVGGPAMLFGLPAGLALVPAAVAIRNKVLQLSIEPEVDMPSHNQWM